MFIVGETLEKSGYLSHISSKLFKKSKNAKGLIMYILFGGGLLSAILMNDTIAIIGTNVALSLSKVHRIPAKILLLTLAFAVTIGSVTSPIGNPQNLLIAIYGNIDNPFITFVEYLFIPTLINLYLTYLILIYYYRNHLDKTLKHVEEPIKDHKLANLSKISIVVILFLIVIKISLIFLHINIDFKLTYIALIAATPIIIFSSLRVEIIKSVDWQTLIFFAAMFILMQSVWDTQFFQQFVNGFNIAVIPLVLLFSILLSQLISNVPMVALSIPILIQSGATSKEMVALAAGSTIAGNLFLLGAASNIIILQGAERKKHTFTFIEFARIGILITFVNALIYSIYLILI
jgi:Na+/H+ antiporter NhaD/arsenite permease-like protein